MKITMKEVNKALPRIDEIRREFTMPGYAGILEHQRGTLMGAFAEVEDDGTVRIRLYAYGDAMERNHYYGDKCVDISSNIIEWVKDYYVDRHDTVESITDALREYYK